MNSILFKSEYIVLYVAVIAICVNVYIAWRNRKYALAKEEYFKLQQVVKKIDFKLLIIESHREKLKIFFELSFDSSHNPISDRSRGKKESAMGIRKISWQPHFYRGIYCHVSF